MSIQLHEQSDWRFERTLIGCHLAGDIADGKLRPFAGLSARPAATQSKQAAGSYVDPGYAVNGGRPGTETR